ncbi:MAG: cupin domain-containing protein [Pseudomonadota bacterium]
MDQAVSPAPYADFIASLETVQSQPLWDRYHRITTRQPQTPAGAHLWSWATMEPLVQRAVDEVAMADAERRVLLFTHPQATGSVDTMRNISGGLQTLLPGEVAHAHRHTLAALRFVMQGQGAVTTVNAEQCAMNEGDLVLTPSWTWHEHTHPGEGRMVWFDGLDLPLSHHLDTMFFEMNAPGLVTYTPPATRPPAVPNDGATLRPDSCDESGTQTGMFKPSRFRYSAERAAAALTASAPRADGSRMLRYIDATSGGPVLPTLDCYLMGLEKGKTTHKSRSTASAICVVAEGEGASVVGDRTIAWRRNDVFTVPLWQWVEHTATSGSAKLFFMSDRELVASMGYLREESDTGTQK